MEFVINTSQFQEMVDITQHIQACVEKSGVKDGLCHVFALHATAAIIINENYDPNICTDIFTALNKNFPDNAEWLHDKVDGNAGSHIKAAILGPSETIPLDKGKLKLGRWQSPMLVELDGPRERTVTVTCVSSG